MTTTGTDGIPGNETSSQIREQLEIGDAVDAAPVLLPHETFGVADKVGSDLPALEIRVHREPVQLSQAIPLSKLDADEAPNSALSLDDLNSPSRAWRQVSR